MDANVNGLDRGERTLDRREIGDVPCTTASGGQVLDPRQIPRQAAHHIPCGKQPSGDMSSKKAPRSNHKNLFQRRV